MTTEQQFLRPISFSANVKSISDDDLCAQCTHCDYKPGKMSSCQQGWPGQENADGYVQQCATFHNSRGDS